MKLISIALFMGIVMMPSSDTVIRKTDFKQERQRITLEKMAYVENIKQNQMYEYNFINEEFPVMKKKLDSLLADTLIIKRKFPKRFLRKKKYDTVITRK